MSLQSKIMDAIKDAMKAKNTVALEALRAVKSELLLAQTQSGAQTDLTEEEEIKILQKLVKQRKDSANIFSTQNRNDLAEPEIAQAAIIEQFLPEQLSEAEVQKIIGEIISKGGFSGMSSMGQVMGIATKELAGKADGKTISSVVKSLLS
ncbi:GatB/YqeY domain-containing protein [Myroides sp. M-43]|uniref:GatB/YqeY domain-containing protein n=1 Tax=Myroides oncorhynchi TaxID=2893756 RepID=UPI001E3C01EF|nr:GatB/YqeY domain-containing protein [Myroides oncorhynchi]MCC9041806.1 GatB/YqeY domain-containing protein [Myroides oncorhynchi]